MIYESSLKVLGNYSLSVIVTYDNKTICHADQLYQAFLKKKQSWGETPTVGGQNNAWEHW